MKSNTIRNTFGNRICVARWAETSGWDRVPGPEGPGIFCIALWAVCNDEREGVEKVNENFRPFFLVDFSHGR